MALTETFATGYGGGSGTLSFNGQSYPFTLIGAVVGPGGAEKVTASGKVYKLTKVADFGGRYTQSSGAAGLSRGGTGELWLENGAGVMHLYSRTEGVLLSIGKEEIFISQSIRSPGLTSATGTWRATARSRPAHNTLGR